MLSLISFAFVKTISMAARRLNFNGGHSYNDLYECLPIL